uniref:Uncharacterized protein n=1 Tax=Salmo trutta TaxID=8032 RepID=A0A674A2H7_SALTR
GDQILFSLTVCGYADPRATHQTETNGEGLRELTQKQTYFCVFSTSKHFAMMCTYECDPCVNPLGPYSGVQLWKLEQRPNVGSMLLRLDFQTNVAPPGNNLFFHISVAYLGSKKFNAESVASMGFYKKQLGLSAQKTRDVVVRLPRLLCESLEPVKENLKMGFRENELQHIVTVIPKVLTANKRKLTQIFDNIHNTMNIPHDLIVKFTQVSYKLPVLNHPFLHSPRKCVSVYISYLLFSLPDEAFCTEVATATLKDFELFQKTV